MSREQELEEQLKTALAEVGRLRALEAQRIEPAIDFDALLQRAEAAEAKLAEAYGASRRLDREHSEMFRKLAEAQQREAWWRDAGAKALRLLRDLRGLAFSGSRLRIRYPEQDRADYLDAELRRLLGLDAAEEKK